LVLVAHGVSDRRGAPAGVLTRPILTVGDSANGYRLVRTTDAIHAYDNGDGTVLAHDAGGLSRWVISADDFTLIDGSREGAAAVILWSTTVDASGFLGEGWRIRIESRRIVAMRSSDATAP
jgi:hypothetical protein